MLRSRVAAAVFSGFVRTARARCATASDARLSSKSGRARVNSMPAKVTREEGRYRIYWAAWGKQIEAVEIPNDSAVSSRSASAISK